MPPVRVLGIDPGSACTGYAILEGDGSRPRLIDSGVIRAGRGVLAERLVVIFEALERLLSSHRPDAVAIEEVFTAKNARSALVLGHARGVALLAAARTGVAVFEYPARRVKQTVTGSGAAEKDQVRRVLQLQLGEVPAELDASDALAVALCHLRFLSPRGPGGKP